MRTRSKIGWMVLVMGMLAVAGLGTIALIPHEPLQTHLPPGATVACVMYSTDERRLAWLLWKPSEAPWEASLHRLIPTYKPHRWTNLILYTSDRNGDHMHEIGRQMLSGEPKKKFGPLSADYDLQWTPDDKHLSFVLQNTLWTVPTE